MEASENATGKTVVAGAKLMVLGGRIGKLATTAISNYLAVDCHSARMTFVSQADLF